MQDVYGRLRQGNLSAPLSIMEYQNSLSDNPLDDLVLHSRRLGFAVLSQPNQVHRYSGVVEPLLNQQGISLANGAVSATTNNRDHLENQGKLESAIARCVQETSDAGTWVTLGHLQDGALICSLTKMSTTNSEGHTLVALLLRKVGWEYSRLDEQKLVTAFDLTTREAQIALHLSCAGDLREFAVAQSVSINTVKSQLQQLFEKLGVKRQIEVAVVVLAALQ